MESPPEFATGAGGATGAAPIFGEHAARAACRRPASRLPTTKRSLAPTPLVQAGTAWPASAPAAPTPAASTPWTRAARSAGAASSAPAASSPTFRSPPPCSALPPGRSSAPATTSTPRRGGPTTSAAVRAGTVLLGLPGAPAALLRSWHAASGPTPCRRLLAIPNDAGIQADGSAWCWGSDYSNLGLLGAEAPGRTDAPGMRFTARYSLEPLPVTPVAAPGPWRSLSCGDGFSCGVKAQSGSAWCWSVGRSARRCAAAARLLLLPPLPAHLQAHHGRLSATWPPQPVCVQGQQRGGAAGLRADAFPALLHGCALPGQLEPAVAGGHRRLRQQLRHPERWRPLLLVSWEVLTGLLREHALAPLGWQHAGTAPLPFCSRSAPAAKLACIASAPAPLQGRAHGDQRHE